MQARSAAGSRAAEADDTLFREPAAPAKRQRLIHPDADMSAEEAAASASRGGYGLSDVDGAAAEMGGGGGGGGGGGKRANLDARQNVLRGYNQHGAVVVVGRGGRASGDAATAASASRAAEARREWVRIPDLSEAPQPSYQQLPAGLNPATAANHAATPFDDARATATNGNGSGGGAASSSDANGGALPPGAPGEAARIAALREAWVARVAAKGEAPLRATDSGVAVAVARGAAAPMAASAVAARAAAARADAAVPAAVASLLQQKSARAVECLRYFYGCFATVPIQAAMRERAQKLRAALREIEADINSIMASFPRDGAQAAVSQSVLRRVNPLLALLHAAFRKAAEEIDK